MRHSLRARVLVLVFLFNVLVFAAGGVFVLTQVEANAEDLEAEITDDLVATIRGTIRPDGLNVARILGWRSWSFFEDAILVDRNLSASVSGRIEPEGVALNPLGVHDRPPEFDHQAALAAILEAIRLQAPVDDVEGGRAVPISGPDGDGWGGIWFRTEDRVRRTDLLARILPWFVLSTLVLTFGTFLAVRRLVLDPVQMLGDGARRVRAGDFSVQLSESKRRDELAELVRSFNEMTNTVRGFNARLAEEVLRATEKARAAEAAAMTQRRLAAMGELAAGIAHEINNPLGGLENAVATLAREDLAPEKRAQYLGLLANGLARIGETVNRLRRFTPREASPEPVDMDLVIQDAVELVRHRADRIGARLECARTGEGSCHVEGARNEIGQAVLNLLANALDALEEDGTEDPDGPRVDVFLRPEEERVTVGVRDNGPGVPAEDLGRVSDLFYSTKEVGKGTGLGLALVHSTLTRHGGDVVVSSERGRFFQVELHFPRRRARPDEAGAEA